MQIGRDVARRSGVARHLSAFDGLDTPRRRFLAPPLTARASRHV